MAYLAIHTLVDQRALFRVSNNVQRYIYDRLKVFFDRIHKNDSLQLSVVQQMQTSLETIRTFVIACHSFPEHTLKKFTKLYEHMYSILDRRVRLLHELQDARERVRQLEQALSETPVTSTQETKACIAALLRACIRVDTDQRVLSGPSAGQSPCPRLRRSKRRRPEETAQCIVCLDEPVRIVRRRAASTVSSPDTFNSDSTRLGHGTCVCETSDKPKCHCTLLHPTSSLHLPASSFSNSRSSMSSCEPTRVICEDCFIRYATEQECRPPTVLYNEADEKLSVGTTGLSLGTCLHCRGQLCIFDVVSV